MLEEDHISESAISSYRDLSRFFEDAFRPRKEWQIGVEFEKLGVDPKTGKALSFSGPNGVQALLLRLAEQFGWTPIYEADCVMGLERGESRITLEPGAQLELSDAPHETMHEVAEQLTIHIQELKAVSDSQMMAWLGHGCQPVSVWKDIEQIPKPRYDIMNKHTSKDGELWRSMMRETAAIQVNMDYEDEEDAMDKFRLSMALSPLFTALFANSSISGGRANGFLTRRAHIWQHTDPQRCGFIEKLYHEDAGFEDYVAYALDVPILFLVRDDQWLDMGGSITFREFLESGYQGHQAAWDDWVLHLSSIFTEVRFKPFLEVRGFDCPLPDLVLTIPALLKGILYDRQARQDAWELVGSWNSLERQVLSMKVSREGPSARIRGIPVREHIREIVQMGREGLKRQDRRNAQDNDESIFLEPLEIRIEEEWDCPARQIISLWHGAWRQEISKLIAFCRF